MVLAFLLAILGGAVTSAWGLLTITPMTSGWLGCGILFGLCWAFLIWGITLNGFDSYMESIMWITGPAAILLCGFSVYCLLVFVWRGIGLHIAVST